MYKINTHKRKNIFILAKCIAIEFGLKGRVFERVAYNYITMPKPN